MFAELSCIFSTNICPKLVNTFLVQIKFQEKAKEFKGLEMIIKLFQVHRNSD
jgi:hypothetical protein